MSLLRSVAVISMFTMASRVLGFVRDILIASVMGAGVMSDAFFVALKLPNFMRRLFAEGAFSAAFIPIFAGKMAKESQENALRFARDALSILVMILLLLTAAVELFMPELLQFMAYGFSQDAEKFSLTVELSRITFPYLLFISITAVYIAIMNSHDRFAAGSAAPIILNLCLIGALLGFKDVAPTAAHALAWAVTAAGVLQVLWMAKFCWKEGVLVLPRKPVWNDDVKHLLKLMAPVALGAGVAQINILIDMVLASSVPQGVSYLYYADRINELPLGIIGIAIGTALLPMLSKQIRGGKLNEAYETQNRALELAALFSLPATVALLVMPTPIIMGLFEHGAFLANDTMQTVHALMAYALGLPAFVMIKVLSPGFFANEDMKTPVKIAVMALMVNLILNLLLLPVLQHVGLALATSVAAWCNVVVMGYILHKRGLWRPDGRLLIRSGRVLMASLLMGVVLYVMQRGAQGLDWGMGLVFERIALLVILVMVGGAVYGAGVVLLKAADIDEMKRLIKRPKSTPVK